MIAECVAAISLTVWIYLVLGRGGFWRVKCDESLPNLDRLPSPRVAIVVPARDEAPTVGLAVKSLVEQDYPGDFHLWLVDDHSSDATAEIASNAAREGGCQGRITIVKASPLPPSWKGKLWALSGGVKSAPSDVDYYFFTDADITHSPDHLTSLVSRALQGNFDLVSEMVKLRCDSIAEKLLIPAFTFFFFMLYPPGWVRNGRRSTAAAAGGCILIRRAALERIGGIAAIRDRLIDDCALARAVKPHGPIRLGLTSQATSARGYGGWREIGAMISRSAFAQLHHSTLLLLGTVIGLLITYVAPPLLLGLGLASAIMGGVAWFLMSVAYFPILRFYGLSVFWAPVLPAIAIFYLGATVHSAFEYWRGHGGLWKGRVQDVAN